MPALTRVNINSIPLAAPTLFDAEYCTCILFACRLHKCDHPPVRDKSELTQPVSEVSHVKSLTITWSFWRILYPYITIYQHCEIAFYTILCILHPNVHYIHIISHDLCIPFCCTVECRYNAVQYNRMSDTEAISNWGRIYIGSCMHKSPHNSP